MAKKNIPASVKYADGTTRRRVSHPRTKRIETPRLYENIGVSMRIN